MHQTMHRSFTPVRAAIAVVLLLGAVACGGTPPAFSTKYPDNSDADIEVLLQRIEAAGSTDAPPVGVGITPAPTQLFAFDLASKRTLWQRPVTATTEPMLAGATVVVGTDDAIAGFDLRSGTPRFSISTEGSNLRGADGAGDLVAITAGEGLGTFARSELIVVRGNTVAFRREIMSQAGVPAVHGTQILVPWSNQYLSSIDSVSGNELARVRVRDGVISHAIADRGSIYVGSQHGITRVTSSIGSGTLKGAGYLTLPADRLPGRPLLLSDVYTQANAQRPDSAVHRIRLAWEPHMMDAIRIGMEDDNIYLCFYRFVFALSPRDYEVRWVYTHPSDLVGASAQPGGLVFGDDQGVVGFLGAKSGELNWSERSGHPSTVFKFPHSGGGAAGEAPDASGLRSALLAAAQDSDARLVPGRLLAVKQLAKMQDAQATASLIGLCDDPQLVPQVKKASCDALKGRQMGEAHLLGALERHAGYLEGTSSPPVGALAMAAASQGVKRAVPLLIAHLRDPGTRSRDLAQLVEALAMLGEPSAAEPLSAFFLLYHADPIDEHLVKALEKIPEVLVKLSGPVAKPALETVMNDGLGSYTVREKARIALGILDEKDRAAAEQAARAEAGPEDAPQAPTPSVDPSTLRPSHLTTSLVNRTLLPVRDELQACMKSASKPTYQARVVLVVEDGQVLMVSVLPAELQGCVEPLVRGQKFPRTRNIKKERLTHTLKRQ